MNIRKTLAIHTIQFIVLIALSAVPALAAVVHLKDGSQVNGTIVSATANNIQVFSDGKTIEIASDRIQNIDYDEAGPPPVRTRRYARRAPPPMETVDFEDMRQMFSFNLGIAAPLSRVDFSSIGGGSADNGDGGFLIGGQYVYYVNQRLGFGGDFEYFGRGPNSAPGLLPFADSSVSGGSLLMMPVMRYTLTSRGWARPYILLGLGIDRTSTAIDSQPNPGFAWSDTNSDETRRLIDDTTWGLASTARIGIDFHFMDPAFFSLEMGWTGIYNGDAQATPAGHDLGLNSVTGNLDALLFSGRWGWRF